MKTFILAFLFVTSLLHVAWGDNTEEGHTGDDSSADPTTIGSENLPFPKAKNQSVIGQSLAETT